MKTLTIAVLAGLTAVASPASARTDCDAGNKTTIYVDKMSGYELADAVRKSLGTNKLCKASGSISSLSYWYQRTLNN